MCTVKLLKLAEFCYGPPILADLAVCLDGPFLNVYNFQGFSVKRIAPGRDRTRIARSAGRRANHCATAASYSKGPKFRYLTRFHFSKLDHLNKLGEVS